MAKQISTIKKMNTQALNILLVEDNEMNQFITRKLLEKWNIGVTIANHGKEALELIVRKCFQLVLMDLDMPEMDGYESARKIREMEDSYFKTVPILAYSASSQGDMTTDVLEAGMNDFINKPIVKEELQEKINQYVKQGKNEIRTLSIDFNQYTDGDSGFQRELVCLLIDNMRELEQSFNDAPALNDPKNFLASCHKVSTTLTVLNDNELTSFIKDLKAQLMDQNQNPAEVFKKRLLQFHRICGDIILSLEKVNQLPSQFAA